MAVFLIGMPKMVDDHWYIAAIKPWFDIQGIQDPENGGNVFRYGIPWLEIIESWKWRYAFDNIRLVNDIYPFFAMFPKWVGSGFATFCLLFSVVAAFKIAGVDIRRSRMVTVGIFLWTFFLPWSWGFGIMDFQFNYILPTAMALALFLLVRQRIAKKGLSVKDVTVIVISSLILGMSHEGVAVPSAAAMCFLVIFYKTWRRPVAILAVVCIVVGGWILLACPGMGSRMNDNLFSEPLSAYIIWVHTPAMLKLMCLFALVSLPFKVFRERLRLPGTAFSMTAALAANAIVLATDAAARAQYPVDFLAITAILSIGNCFCGKLRIGNFRLHGICNAVALACIFVHLGFVGAESLKCREFMKGFVAGAGEVRGATWFEPAPMHGSRSPFCLYMPDRLFVPRTVEYVEAYLDPEIRNTVGHRLATIPYALKKATADAGEAASARAGIRSLEGMFFMPDSVYRERVEVDVYSKADLWYDFGKGLCRSYSTFYPFVSPEDGKKYVWIHTSFPWYVEHFKTVQNIAFADAIEK